MRKYILLILCVISFEEMKDYPKYWDKIKNDLIFKDMCYILNSITNLNLFEESSFEIIPKKKNCQTKYSISWLGEV